MSYNFNDAEKSRILQSVAESTGLSLVNGVYTDVEGADKNSVPAYQAIYDVINERLDSPEGLDAATISQLKSAKAWLSAAIELKLGENWPDGVLRDTIKKPARYSIYGS
jgi:hypothetical protein